MKSQNSQNSEHCKTVVRKVQVKKAALLEKGMWLKILNLTVRPRSLSSMTLTRVCFNCRALSASKGGLKLTTQTDDVIFGGPIPLSI